MRLWSDEAGFALMEALVATLIVAGMTAMLFDAMGANARATRMVSERRAAMLVAQSAMAKATVNAPAASLAPENGTYAVSVRTSDYDTNARASGPPAEIVTITVTRPPQVEILARLETLRLKR